jgi:PTH1 family peptidyl-tRNA hydrolase
MKLIVGLGNPGRGYERSRHNAGYRVIDALGRRWSVSEARRQHQGVCGSGHVDGEKVVLLKPETYMNLSGASVLSAVQFYKLNVSELLVIVDDMALPLGQLRLRGQGSAGGHNGLADIISRLGTNEWARLRVGIGEGRGGAVSHVLGEFSEEQETVIAEAIERAADAAGCWVREGLEAAMNRYNARIEQD